MSLYFIGSLIVSIVLITHCVRTGRSALWIFALAMLPVAGALAYVAVEIVPALFRSRTTRRAVRGVKRALDPQQDLRRLEDDARASGGVAQQQRYAEELLRQGRAVEAVDVYRSALRGLYEHDPNLMLGLATAQFARGTPAEARATLDLLIAQNPDFRSPAGHLLYARALEAEGNTEKALEEYRVLAGYYAGAEAPYRYAHLLRAGGHAEEAHRVLRELLDHARRAPRHYRQAQKEWLVAAEREIAEL